MLGPTKVFCSFNGANVSTDTFTVSEDSFQTSSNPFQSHDNESVVIAVFTKLSSTFTSCRFDRTGFSVNVFSLSFRQCLNF